MARLLVGVELELVGKVNPPLMMIIGVEEAGVGVVPGTKLELAAPAVDAENDVARVPDGVK